MYRFWYVNSGLTQCRLTMEENRPQVVKRTQVGNLARQLAGRTIYFGMYHLVRPFAWLGIIIITKYMIVVKPILGCCKGIFDLI